MSPFVSKLLEVVKLLALAADDQLAAMPPVDDVPGEIVDLFCDQFDLVSEEELQRELGAGADALIALREVAEIIAEISQDHSVRALRAGPHWAEARDLARSALELLAIEPTRPQLDWIKYA